MTLRSFCSCIYRPPNHSQPISECKLITSFEYCRISIECPFVLHLQSPIGKNLAALFSGSKSNHHDAKVFFKRRKNPNRNRKVCFNLLKSDHCGSPFHLLHYHRSAFHFNRAWIFFFTWRQFFSDPSFLLFCIFFQTSTKTGSGRRGCSQYLWSWGRGFESGARLEVFRASDCRDLIWLFRCSGRVGVEHPALFTKTSCDAWHQKSWVVGSWVRFKG